MFECYLQLKTVQFQVKMFLLLILCAFFAIYFYIRKCNNYWKKHGVVSVKTNFLLGTSFDFLTGRRSLEETHDAIYQAEPNEPFVGIYNILKPVLFIRDPELINLVTVKDFSHFYNRGEEAATAGGRLVYSVFALQEEEWKIVRNKLIPTFSSNKMRNMYGLIEECATMLMNNHFSHAAKINEPVDVREIMTRYTLDVLGCCAFGLQFNTLKDSKSLYLKVAQIMTDFSGFKNAIRFIMRIFCPSLIKLFNVKQTSEEVENFFFTLLHDAEALRRKELKHRGDFLQLMLDIRDKEDNKASYLFTENHIVSNMFVFYFAGHETTSNTISFALYELAKHPEVQEKLRDEINKAREANGGILNYDMVKNLKYLEMVISETLRLHAPASINARTCTEAYQLPDSSYIVQPGDKVLYSISAMHKDQKYFPNPEKFDPERFSEENKARRNPFVYQPFGSGPRICLGLRFAQLEIKVCLVNVLSRYKLSQCSKTENPIILNPKSVFHSAKNGIWLSIQEIGDP